jgi:hypothetical protein
MRTAAEYLEDIDTASLVPKQRDLVRKFAARMDSIDSKMIALKGERRMLANWLLALKARPEDGPQAGREQ